MVWQTLRILTRVHVVECMEVEEEENVNGDVILRCLCNESEEG